MAKKRKPKSLESGRDYEVGYGKPPRHGQFQPGESGNPAGRPRGLNNFITDLRRALGVPVKVKVGDRWRKMSTQEAALMLLRETACRRALVPSNAFSSSRAGSTTNRHRPRKRPCQ